MLSPEYLRMITELTEQKVSEVNEYLTAKIINRIMKLFEETGEVKLIPSSLLDIKKQQSAGRLLDEIQIELEKQLPDIQKEIRRAFHDAGAKIAADVNATTGEILKTVQRKGDLTDVSMPEFESKQKAMRLSDLNMTEKEISCLESAYRRTQGELYNLTKTSANSAQQTFIKACDTAYFKATHGTSLDAAIVEAIREVSEKGITTIHYASGHEDKIEVAIARAVRTGVNQANGDITLTRCAEVGVNYVITSSHIGARVTPYADYRTHADWQGQVYSLDWNRPELSQYEPQAREVPKGKFAFLNDMKEFFQNQKNKKYKDFIEACGYGKMLGICGINCRHSFGLFYPGISINNQMQYDSEENKKRYQQEQKQRAMERGIRLIKRELNGLDGSGLDTEEAKMRKQELKELLQIRDAEYKAYCQKNGLKPLNYRLQVAKVSGVENVGIVNFQNEDSDLGERVKQLFNRKDVIKDFEKGLTQVKNGDVRTLLQQAKGRTQFIKTDKKGSHYDSSTHSVHYGKNALPGTIAHELFHEIYDTYRMYDDNFLGKSVRSDYSRLLNFAKGYGKSVEEMLYLKYPNALYINETGKIVVYEKYRGISDIIHGASDGKVDLGYGHRRPGYWSKYKALEKETFSQFGRMFYDQDEDVLKVLEKLFGETYKEVIERLEGMIK